ncbi:GRIP and coiled-coil domain-containing protein 2 [Pectinophora gossypiella]|uniref:GRIP and coiled-coil domain-containing protein 2 n=1 Tax=Pectinophora gossypiella TaxID=13191 RepID=UPI00214F11CF|nr:GRIP and coiled-coil domain-containing protein 2 [Pectinophora gossypiella]
MDSNTDTAAPDGGGKKSVLEDLNKDELISKCKGFLAIAQKAKQAKIELQNQVESYKLQLEKCETEKKVCLENVRTLQELVDSLTEQKLNYITDLDAAQNKIKTYKTKCDSYEEEIKKYESNLILKEKQNIGIAQQLSDLDSEIISLKRQNNRLEDENEQLINQLSDLETRVAEFNNIGLEQREQLKILEEKVQSDEAYKIKIDELYKTIEKLENELKTAKPADNKEADEYENKIKELTHKCESEKVKNEKANIKLRSYKDKILKCAACINQLKNSRFILTKTVKEYSENIPKWRNDIIKASKVLEDEINTLNNENKALKEKLQNLEKQADQKTSAEVSNAQITELTSENCSLKKEILTLKKELQEVISNNATLNNDNGTLRNELSNSQKHLQDNAEIITALHSELAGLKYSLKQLTDTQLTAQVDEIISLKTQLNESIKKNNDLTSSNCELNALITDLKSKNKKLNQCLETKNLSNTNIESLNLQIKALESEKATLVKEKLNARDNIIELENQNKILSEQIKTVRSEVHTLKTKLENLTLEKSAMEGSNKKEKEGEISNLKSRIKLLQEQFDLLKNEHDNLQDLNGLLKEEVETLKLSLEQPRDDAGNLSDLNDSLQADIVKLETKLSAYKQENASLLAEVKETRVKVKEFDNLVSEYEEMKSKVTGYKTENAELLNEMKEINQVLKERGEAISKLQKAVTEMERLIETLEKDRDNINQEKDDLNKKIGSLESELKNAQQQTDQSSVVTKKIVEERDKAAKVIAEKDELIANLKDEIDKYKQQQTSSELPNEDMSTSTISKADEHSRMKDLDETFEEKYTKLRIFALKLKKKLNETTAQLQNAEQDKARLEKLLNEQERTDIKAAVTTGTDQVDSAPKVGDGDGIKSDKVTELELKVKTLQAAVDASEKIAVELGKVKSELHTKTEELASEVEAHKATKESLERARRDVKKKNVLSLEMEDYERSMKELTAKMEESKKKMVQMESTIDTQEGTITAMKTQIKLLEEQIKTEETQNRLIKEELQHVIEEGQEKDNVIQLKNGIIAKLEQDLEDEKRKNEEADLEMTSILSEKEKIIMNIGEEKTELHNKLKRLEFRCAELNETLRITNIELADLKTEYTSYKVRAQAVLRQNQTVDHSQEEQLKEEAAALRTQIETITAKLATAQEQLSEQSSEIEASRRRETEALGEAARAQQRTTRLQADLTRLGQQLESERAQHKLQVSTLTQCYKTQITELETKLQKDTEALRKQLVAAQENAKSVKVGSLDEENHNPYMLPVIPKEEGSDGEMDINVSMIPREEGEGSESAPSPPLSKPYLTSAGSGRSPVPLERLLEEGVPEDEALDATSLGLTPEQEICDLRRKLQAQQQRVKHVTVLLSESERECARMAQLSELLKAELRRVRGTTANAHNTEYMKNVTLKFLTLPSGDERSRLVPVLQKILTLTPEETHKIQAIAKGLDPNPSKGWGSYLPWPGGSKTQK